MYISNIFSRIIRKKPAQIPAEPAKAATLAVDYAHRYSRYFSPQTSVSPIIFNIKTAFRKRVNLSVDTYERMLAGADGKTLGNLPKDILSAIISSSNGDKQAKSQKIKQLLQAFKDISEILKPYTQIETNAYCKGDKLSLEKIDIIRQILKQPIALRAVDCTEQTQPLYKKAQNILKTAMQDFIPNGTEIKIKDIGNGYFGNVFKISFTAPNGKKVFNDIAMKCFKSEQEIFENWISRLQFAENFVASIPSDELLQLISKIYPDIKSQSNLTFYMRMIQNHNASDTFMHRDFIDGIHAMLNSNGVMAEANSTEFIRFFTGHKLTDRDDMILPDLFIFGKFPFCLSKFEEASENTAKPTKKVLLNILNLIHNDAKHDGNKINGKIIDIGGVKSLKNSMFQNKTTIKQLKRFLRTKQPSPPNS